MEEKRSDNSALFFLLGLAVGVAAGLYLNSEQGRRVRRSSAKAFDELSDVAEGKAKDIIHKTQNYAEDLVEWRCALPPSRVQQLRELPPASSLH